MWHEGKMEGAALLPGLPSLLKCPFPQALHVTQGAEPQMMNSSLVFSRL